MDSKNMMKKENSTEEPMAEKGWKMGVKPSTGERTFGNGRVIGNRPKTPAEEQVTGNGREIDNGSKEEEAGNKSNKMEDFLNEMENSKTRMHRNKGGFFLKRDSKQYSDVKSALSTVVEIIKRNFSEDVQKNVKMIQEASHNYYDLIDKCKIYINKEGGKTSSGEARKKKVRQILDFAQEDLSMVHDLMSRIRSLSAAQQKQLSWQKILYDARAEVLEMDDFYGETDTLGNSTSGSTAELKGRKFKQGVFFKERTLGDEGRGGSTERNSSASNRNIAYSRVANLIGLGGMIAQSKSAKVHDKKTDTMIPGIMMDWAKGKEANADNEQRSQDIRNQIEQDEKVEKDSFEEREKRVSAMVAPTVQKELCSLQVLDYICDQSDRHQGNYFAKEDEKTGKISHIQGIDNDHSFRKNSGIDTAAENIKKNTPINKLDVRYARGKYRFVVDADGKLSIPHMDKQLAQNIKNLAPEELRFVLSDLLEQDYIDPAVKRLERLQAAIRAEEENPKSNVFLEDSGWGEESHRNLLENSFDYQSNKNGRWMAEDVWSENSGRYGKWEEKLSFKEGEIKDDDKRCRLLLQDNYYAWYINDMIKFDENVVDGKTEARFA